MNVWLVVGLTVASMMCLLAAAAFVVAGLMFSPRGSLVVAVVNATGASVFTGVWLHGFGWWWAGAACAAALVAAVSALTAVGARDR